MPLFHDFVQIRLILGERGKDNIGLRRAQADRQQQNNDDKPAHDGSLPMRPLR